MMQWNLLTTTLTANAVFSGLSGLVLTIGARPTSEWLGIPTWISVAVGLGLMVFSAQVAMTARNPQPPAVRMVIAGDAAWVVIATGLIVFFPESMSTAGLVALGIVTVGVTTFAVLQWLGLRIATRSEDAVPVGA
jgi:hypothetical protein